MIRFEFKPIQQSALFNTAKAQQILAEESQSTLDRIIPKIHTSVVKAAPIGADGRLAGSIGFDLRPKAGRVFVGVAYGAVVERGRAPGSFPPIRPIQRWLSGSVKGRKWFDDIMAAGVVKALRAADRLRQAAFIKARAIFRHGTKAQPFFSTTITDQQPFVDAEVRDYQARVLRRLSEP